MIRSKEDAIMFYYKNASKIHGMIETNLKIIIKELVPEKDKKDFLEPTYLFTIDPLDKSGMDVLIGLTYMSLGFKEQKMEGLVYYVENKIAISVTEIFKYLSIVSGMDEISEEHFVDCILFCAIHEGVHYIQAYGGVLDVKLDKAPEELFILQDPELGLVDIRKYPKRFDIYGRFIETMCIYKCNELFDKGLFGNKSEIYKFFSTIGFISISFIGKDYGNKMEEMKNIFQKSFL